MAFQYKIKANQHRFVSVRSLCLWWCENMCAKMPKRTPIKNEWRRKGANNVRKENIQTNRVLRLETNTIISIWHLFACLLAFFIYLVLHAYTRVRTHSHLHTHTCIPICSHSFIVLLFTIFHRMNSNELKYIIHYIFMLQEKEEGKIKKYLNQRLNRQRERKKRGKS